MTIERQNRLIKQRINERIIYNRKSSNSQSTSLR